MNRLFDPHAIMSAGSLQNVLQFARQHQISSQDVLRGTRLQIDQYNRPDSHIEAWQEVQALRNLCRYFDHPFSLGLQLGEQYHITSYGMWGLAMMSCATFKEAVNLGTRYLSIASPFNRVSLQLSDRQVHFDLNDQHLPEDLRPLLVARDLASIAVILQSLVPQRFPAMQSLAIAFEPIEVHHLQRLFGCPVHWNQNRHRLSADRHLLDERLQHANPTTAQLCATQCQQQQQRLSALASTAGRVKYLLMQQLENAPSMQQIAEDLHTSPRTLRRQLDSEGTNWRDLMNDVRMQLAERLLKETNHSLQHIAERLGYADVSSFSHAFKRRQHCSPDQYRRQCALIGAEVPRAANRW